MSKHTLIHSAILMVAFIFLLLLVSGCDSQGRGFALPDGNVEDGKTTFVSLACNECHSIGGAIEKLEAGHPDIHFKLGGPVTRVKTYGDLVTSIINPSHKISGYAKSAVNIDAFGDSNMRIYNDVMTVQQLIDLTTYLETTYDVIKPAVAPMYGP
ncbi:MAG: sulfur-oxidizing protein SoxX [Limisphaerales bacterium]|jgi:sulfur-oxidizing protein SoxX